MCGIIGLVNVSNQKEIITTGLGKITSRGTDSTNILEMQKVIFGHNLHSIVGFVNQPIFSQKGMLIINCEIYNWKEIAKKSKLKPKNDAELVFLLLEKNGINGFLKEKIVEEFDGDFSFAYYSKNENKIILGRDILGVKPLVYGFDKKKKQFYFASEKKALPFESIHLNPRKILIFDTKKNSINFIERKISDIKTKKGTELVSLSNFLTKSILKRVPEKKFGVLFSGGIDSTLIVDILKEHEKEFVNVFSYIDGLSEPKDLENAKKVSNLLEVKLFFARVSLEEFEKELPKIISLIESTDPIRVGVASTIYFASKKLSSVDSEIKVVFSGLGADEIFAGYDRFKRSTNINKDCFSYLIKMYENDLYYQDIVLMYNKLELRVPFLDKKLVEFGLNLDPKFKIDKKSGENKLILRELALSLGLPKEIAYRKKKAAQYGSNFDKAIEKLAKNNGFVSKADYLNSLLNKNNPNQKNIPIAALISTGKDSIYAMHLMQKQGYGVKCLITIDSSNKDSFMFHTPTIKLAKLQAIAMNLPLIIVKTKGVKEIELK
ncbi:MAG TPA: asparagine synthase-related protein, partial [archaeon]|nr:asparagine synthase-related protein [archaeon]